MKTPHLSLLLVILLVCGNLPLKAQLAFSPFVDSISELATTQSTLTLLKQLSGDTTVTVNGQVTTIASRHYLNPNNAKAAQFIFDKFTEYGYQPVIQNFNGSRGANVIATRIGTRYPDQQYIICGHYDNMPSGNLAPGSDDNASGTVATLEAARILSGISTDYTVKFIAWDEEEIGLVGSQYYAQQAYNNGDQILGVLNLDMIAWDSDNDNLYSIAKDANSSAFSDDFVSTTAYYEPQLTNNYINTTASDHASFWQYGYPSILAIEDFYDFNAYYHTINDNISHVNIPYFLALVRASIANIAACALNQRIYMEHNPVISGNSTEPREAVLIVTSEHPIANSTFAPRLYYSTDSVNFNFVLPTQSIADTFTFMIPGSPLGTTVCYYFAVQDSAGMMTMTYPTGGRGINPPGTVAPNDYFTYMVDNILFSSPCSPNTPLAITDNANTYDQLLVAEEGALLDLDVLIDITHPRTYELRIILISPDNTSIMLSDRNGGEGDNYTQTLFDDHAAISIKNGIAPFTGRYTPQASFTSILDKTVHGTWKLRIVESGYVNTSTLNEWCLHFLYRDPSIGTNDIQVEDGVTLFQNYPNPVQTSTSFKFHLTEKSNITLTVYNNHGQKVRTLASGNYLAGDHLIVTSLNDLKPGAYVYKLESDHFTLTKQLIKVQ